MASFNKGLHFISGMLRAYFIVSPEHEPDRYKLVLENIKKFNDYKILCEWATPGIAEKYGTGELSHKTKDGHVSVYMNYMNCLRDIRDNYTQGNFLIFESDAIFFDNFNENIEKVVEIAKKIPNWGIINIGEGIGRPPWPPGIYKTPFNSCSEGIMWNYESACKFLEFAEKCIDIPIDIKMEKCPGLDIYWLHPPLVYQGSIHKIFKSHDVNLQ